MLKKSREYTLKALYSIDSIYYDKILCHKKLCAFNLKYCKFKKLNIVNYTMYGFDKIFFSSKKSYTYNHLLLIGIYNNITIIDSIINVNLHNWKFERINMIEKNILRLAIYEMLYTNTSASIIINEAVEMSKKYTVPKAFKFVNGILNNIKRYKNI